jgi:hypothetical protein
LLVSCTKEWDCTDENSGAPVPSRLSVVQVVPKAISVKEVIDRWELGIPRQRIEPLKTLTPIERNLKAKVNSRFSET